jgi:hypothetical protein
MCDSQHEPRKETHPKLSHENPPKKVWKTPKRKNGIHKQITREQDNELQTFHTSWGKILYKEASNIPSSFPLDICNRALASLWNGRERGKQDANELGFQELAAIHLLTSLYEGHWNTKIPLLHKTRP